MGRKDYSELQAKFMAWMVMTDEEKVSIYGDTKQGTFAKAHGLPHEKLLSEWKAKPKFQKAYRDAFVDTFKKELPKARNTLMDRAIKDGDVGALKEVFKIAGLSVERVESVSSSDLQDFAGSVIEIIKKHVKDPEVLSAIAEDLEELDY